MSVSKAYGRGTRAIEDAYVNAAHRAIKGKSAAMEDSVLAILGKADTHKENEGDSESRSERERATGSDNRTDLTHSHIRTLDAQSRNSWRVSRLANVKIIYRRSVVGRPARLDRE